ncbi:OmpA family protein [Thorsellia anophelis]|uniref:Outer membrane protein OmpA n=1 Tax=Thorsellia anophelis DSM 18579 TaxID=1123402 RepID=A0A1I0FAT5_9GAMM|nr:OmpA family protein [Thorsellia anophelis]SET55327.1 Outer membrane protein OmpA [Thorsellia anophelis DSM 18579]
MTDRLRLLSQLFGCVLLAVLIIVYMPLTSVLRIVGLVIVFCIMLLLVLWGSYWRKSRSKRISGTLLLPYLPPAGYQQPIVFVTGDGLSNLFGDKTVIEQPEGCFIRIDDTECLTDILCNLVTEHPLWVSQLHLFHVFIPEFHTDDVSLRVGLKQWRWQLTRVRKQLGCSPTASIVSYFADEWQVKSTLSETNLVRENSVTSPWFCQFHENSRSPFSLKSIDTPFEVHTASKNRHSLAAWVNQTSASYNDTQRYAYALKLNVARDFLYNDLLSECWQAERLAKPIVPFCIVIHFAPLIPVTENVWSHWLAERTGLQSTWQEFTKTAQLPHNEITLPLPVHLLTNLPRQNSVRPIEKTFYNMMLAGMVFIVCVLMFSYQNNQHLVKEIGEHLAEYYQIAMGNEPSKHGARLKLEKDAKRLEYYYRTGEPPEFGAGLYQGAYLYPHILTAIATYVAPPPRIEPVKDVSNDPIKQIIRLDSLSLFDVGKFALKPEATPGLIRAVVDIKAQPGYVILITGHTDNTGNEKDNELLSLKRAEAVRDWMMEVSDLPINCFAVQGYGASQPITSNTTEAGRQQNRRVEISLVPEVSACQLTDMAPAL